MAIDFIFPSKVRRITSKFRTKSRPNHNGVDIAQSGTHDIFAVADGRVTRSYLSSSYGEVIFIVHDINGETYESVYAHLRSGTRRVKVGDWVRRGEKIGIMGNTGKSTGQHLHFELHDGRWNYAKSNAVDPLDYLDKSIKENGVTLKNGDKGQAVKNVQLKLINLGFALPKYGADKDFGDETEAAVKAFQKSRKITVDGIVGPVTKAELNKAEAKDTVYLPSGAPSWRLYPLDKAPTKGNEKNKLRPSKYNGLTYEVLDRPQKNVVTIQTKDFGIGNIYVGPGTGAVIR